MSTPLSCSNAARCSQFIIKCRQKDRTGEATCQRCSPSRWFSAGVPARALGALTSQSFQPQEDMGGGRLNFKFLQVSISNRQMFFITLLCSGVCQSWQVVSRLGEEEKDKFDICSPSFSLLFPPSPPFFLLQKFLNIELLLSPSPKVSPSTLYTFCVESISDKVLFHIGGH